MFALFANKSYYASGGWHDFRGAFASKDEAVKRALAILGTNVKVGTYGDDGDPEDDITVAIEWWHVVDLNTREIVAGSRHQAFKAPHLDESLRVTATER